MNTATKNIFSCSFLQYEVRWTANALAMQYFLFREVQCLVTRVSANKKVIPSLILYLTILMHAIKITQRYSLIRDIASAVSYLILSYQLYGVNKSQAGKVIRWFPPTPKGGPQTICCIYTKYITKAHYATESNVQGVSLCTSA